MRETCSIRNINDHELEIKIPSKLTTKIWFEQMGDIQRRISQSNLLKVTVDFSDCVWADPFPLMSLSLSLKYLVKHNGNVSIIIPFFEKNSQNTDASKFLKFLAQEGFIKEFCISFCVSNGIEKILPKDIYSYLSVDTKLTYTDSELLPFSIIKLDDLGIKENICEYVDKLIEQQISIRLSSKLSDNVYKKTLANIFHCLCELIENVKMHAYEDTNEQYFGVYVRYRKGINTEKAGEISPEMTTKLRSSINDEGRNCPALDNDILLNSDSIVEIFVVDVGMGLSGSLAKEYVYAARELFRLVLKEGIRKKQTQEMSAYGGLYFITRLLEENGGYIWCKNQGELVGAYGSEILDNNPNRIRSTIDFAEYHVPGLCWCVRLSCADENKLKGDYYKLFSGVATEHPAYKAYCCGAKCYDFPMLFCVDDRKFIENCATITKKKEELHFIDRDSSPVVGKNFEVEEYLWFPKEKMTKNILIYEIKKYMNVFVNVFEKSPIEQKELTIFDVPNSQLLTYYNALNALDGNGISADHINKITIIGEHFEVMCFSKEKGKFVDANGTINEASQAFSNLLYEKVDLLRKYDSYIFWTLVDKYNTDNLLYVSDKIKWSKDMVLNGYLDFDTLYSFAPFLNLLIKTLERVKGLFYDARVTFCDIDDIPKRICNEVNGTYLYSDRYKMNFVNVGSVWVSGYKRNSFAFENEAKFDVHFFLHSDSVVESNREAFLLIWPNSSIVPYGESESALWKRLGRTNLIGKTSPNPTIIDSSKVYYKNSSRGKKEGYFDLQNKYPNIAKIGHYSTDNHHYFLAFDFFPIIKLSYFQREGLFLYLLCQIFFRLVKDSNFDSIYNEMIQNGKSAWAEIIKSNRAKYNRIKKVSIVLYHSNSYTEYAINYLKQILPEGLNRIILPVNLHSIQNKGMPPVLSKNTIGKILNILDKSKSDSNSVLYFDSNISSGQTINRIRNSLSSSTNRTLVFFSLSIMDTQRLPYVDSTTNTYWKFNMPRMEKIDECVLCSSLEKAKVFQSMVILECRQRINEWFIAWNPIGVSKSVPGAGLPIESITLVKKQTVIDEVNITNSLGKIMQVMEHVCETYDNDFAVKICAYDNNISTSIKIQILCAQIILYGNQKTRNLQQNILLFLMKYMTDNQISENCSSLAALILLSQEESLMYNVLNEVYNSERPAIEEIRKAIDESTNRDFIMVIAYFIKMSKSISELSITLSSRFADSIIKRARDVLLADRDFKNICKEFHGLLYNENGGNHNVEIEKTLSENPDDFSEFKARYERVKDTIITLCEYADILPSVYQNKFPKEQSFLSAMISTLKSNLFSAIDSDIIDKEKENGNTLYTPNNRVYISDDVRKILTEIKKQFQILHVSYFVSDSEETRKYLFDMVAQKERKYSKRIKINYLMDEASNSIGHKDKKKWYFWSSSIETEFEYLLNNVEHTKMKFKDGDDEIDMKLDVCISRTALYLSTTSFSDKPACVVKEDFKNKDRLQKEQATQFDVIFDFDDLDQNTVTNPENYYKLISNMLVPAVFGNYIRR